MKEITQITFVHLLCLVVKTIFRSANHVTLDVPLSRVT